ncbi:MAG: hypothetical protein ACT4OM_12900 [Actinomycetota bacterium]
MIYSTVEDVYGSDPTCHNCGGRTSDEFELSRLVHGDEGLMETPVVALINLCYKCVSLIATGEWGQLRTRSAA